MVPLTIPSVSCDDYTSANSITWLKGACHTSFQLSLHNEQNAAIDDDAVGIA